jgi:hypothetical protein
MRRARKRAVRKEPQTLYHYVLFATRDTGHKLVCHVVAPDLGKAELGARRVFKDGEPYALTEVRISSNPATVEL